MAFVVTPIFAGVTLFIADIEANADADTDSPDIPHGLGAIPLDVTITPLLQAEAGLSLWALTGLDAVNLVVSKSAAVGSGAAAAQLRLTARLPHTLVQ